MSKQQIVNYYESCESDYRMLWDLEKSLALHAGFWDPSTRTLREALAKENEFLAKLAKVNPSDHVLDAGCGVGGSSIYLAKHFGCRVTGITLSPKQVLRANQFADNLQIFPKPVFLVEDFHRTGFGDEAFDLVWAVESVCHAEPKDAFIAEAFRVLKPGGRMVIADGFYNREWYSSKEKKQMHSWLKGWGVEGLESIASFRRKLSENGFQKISFIDMTVNVMPSSKRLFLYSYFAFPLSKIGQMLGLRTKIQSDNILSARFQYLTLKKELWKYGIFYAEKSSESKC